VVEKIGPPSGGQIFVRDDQLTGLALRITAKGVKSFVFEGRIRGRMRRITVGQYPAMTVLRAREEVLKIKAAIAEGKDPADQRREERSEIRFKAFAELYLERHAKKQKRSWRQDRRMIESYLSKWQSRKLSDIRPEDIAQLHDKVGREHGPYTANRVLALLRSMFNLARGWGYLKNDNPVRGIKFFPERKRERFLSPDELKRVLEALSAERNKYWQAYFLLCLLLGPRRSELLGARWADVDLKQRQWAIPSTKAGRSHLLPLPEPAVTILQRVRSGDTSEFLFPGHGATGHLVEPKKAWQRIRGQADVPDVTIHDLRRTLGSWLAARGESLNLVGKVLNHSSVSTTQVYARLSLEPVRRALEANAAQMLGVLPQQPKQGKVDPGVL
jgi:integrase